jgi:signal transduction histidine kinase
MNLQENKELESFYKFTSFVIHDLRNVVSVLAMLAENAKTNMDNADFRKSLVRTLSDSVNSMKGMLSKISMTTGKFNLNPEQVDIANLLENVISGIDIPDTIGIKTKIAQNVWVDTDPTQLRKVVTNLLLNAIEAAGDGGEIEIEMNIEDKSMLPVELAHEWTEAEFVKITVKDNGGGMSEEFIQRKLFRPFQTTKKKGLGIGLYHSKEIIKSLKAEIWVQSKLNAGTTFFIALSKNVSSPEIVRQELRGEIEPSLKRV